MNQEKSINFEIEVEAPLEELWRAWTTEEGTRSFFAPECKVDLKVYGEYEMYFAPDAPEGSRGGEGCKILAFQENHFLSFTWNAPPHLPTVRDQKTVVIIRFARLSYKLTKLNFTHLGWGTGDEWDQAYEYFVKAWGEIVLPRLQKRFIEGPYKWE